MGETLIEWADRVWNPVTGCTKVSEGCAHCYAERMAHRLAGRYGYPREKPFAVTVHPDRLDEPLRIRKPSRIFVCSMGDLFHPDVPDGSIAEVFGVMAVAAEPYHGPGDGRTLIGKGPIGYPNSKHGPHTFMVLTKRPERMREILTSPRFQQKVASAAYRRAMDRRCAGDVYQSISGRDLDTDYGCLKDATHWPLPNLWLGVSVENQARADERIAILLQIPAAIHFVSYEPALGAVDLTGYRGEFTSRAPRLIAQGAFPYRVDWVIAGGETGPEARPAHPDWFRKVRNDCKAAGVAFYFKAWGAWAPFDMVTDFEAPKLLVSQYGGSVPEYCGWGRDNPAEHYAQMVRVGKRRAGRLLDGVEHGELPVSD